jgi:hypothetical protein
MDVFALSCDAARVASPIDLKIVDDLVERFYDMDGNGSGGPVLHAVLDDTNLDDESIDSAIENAQRHSDAAALALGRLLRAMALPDRLKLTCVCDCGCVAELRANGASNIPLSVVELAVPVRRCAPLSQTTVDDESFRSRGPALRFRDACSGRYLVPVRSGVPSDRSRGGVPEAGPLVLRPVPDRRVAAR